MNLRPVLPLIASGLALGLVGCGQPEAKPAPAPTQAGAHKLRPVDSAPGGLGMTPKGPSASSGSNRPGVGTPATGAPPATGSGGTRKLPGSGSARPRRPGSGSARPAPQPMPPGPVQAAGLHFELPEGWTRLAPSSRMRAAQAEVAGPAGKAEMTMFFFGEGGGGGVEANLQRWIGQMSPVAGSEPERQSFEESGTKVHLVSVVGTRQPAGFGMGPSKPLPDQQMLGAVVEGPGGPWFFKLVGPRETVAGSREGFVAMLRAVRPQAR